MFRVQTAKQIPRLLKYQCSTFFPLELNRTAVGLSRGPIVEKAWSHPLTGRIERHARPNDGPSEQVRDDTLEWARLCHVLAVLRFRSRAKKTYPRAWTLRVSLRHRLPAVGRGGSSALRGQAGGAAEGSACWTREIRGADEALRLRLSTNAPEMGPDCGERVRVMTQGPGVVPGYPPGRQSPKSPHAGAGWRHLIQLETLPEGTRVPRN